MRKGILALVAAAFAVPARASQPGNPMDCGDWVFLEAGLACSSFAPIGTLSENSMFLKKGTNLQMDTAGNLYALRLTVPAGDYRSSLGRLEVVRFNGQQEQV